MRYGASAVQVEVLSNQGVMRCDNCGDWTATRKFVRAGTQDALVTIR